MANEEKIVDEELINISGGASEDNRKITFNTICTKCKYRGSTSEFTTSNHYGFTCPKCGNKWK